MPEPYYRDENVTLYHGDCLEVTEWLKADVLVTDPPYGRDWKQGELKGHFTANRTGIANDATSVVRDAALTLWGERQAVVFGDLMLAPPVGTKHVLIYRKPSNAGLRGAVGGYRRGGGLPDRAGAREWYWRGIFCADYGRRDDGWGAWTRRAHWTPP